MEKIQEWERIRDKAQSILDETKKLNDELIYEELNIVSTINHLTSFIHFINIRIKMKKDRQSGY